MYFDATIGNVPRLWCESYSRTFQLSIDFCHEINPFAPATGGRHGRDKGNWMTPRNANSHPFVAEIRFARF
jgi:hypothetical protein